jgi:hypothetical protein
MKYCFCVYGAATENVERMKEASVFKGRHVHHALAADLWLVVNKSVSKWSTENVLTREIVNISMCLF